jgi:hypothetical protein
MQHFAHRGIITHLVLQTKNSINCAKINIYKVTDSMKRRNEKRYKDNHQLLVIVYG